MAALFIARRGIINIYRASASPRYCNNNTLQSSRCFAGQGSDGGREPSASMNEARQEAMGTSTDAKAPDVSVSFAADTAKEGLKRATDIAKEESGHAPSEDAAVVAGSQDDSEENVTVGEIGTVKGQNESSS